MVGVALYAGAGADAGGREGVRGFALGALGCIAAWTLLKGTDATFNNRSSLKTYSKSKQRNDQDCEAKK